MGVTGPTLVDGKAHLVAFGLNPEHGHAQSPGRQSWRRSVTCSPPPRPATPKPPSWEGWKGERGKAEAWAAREANQLTAREKDEAERIEQARKEAAAEAEERHHREWAEAIHREDNARIRHRIKCEIAAAMASLPQPIASKTATEALVVRGVPNTTVRF